jgi:release factor glutamine methyltransferase
MTLLIREKQWLLDEKYGGMETPEFFADLEKLESGTPLAYLISSIPFLGCHIDLSSKPLIPRPETEYWVNEIIKHYIPQKPEMKILDIFSGSGCVGVAVLKHTSNIVHFGELQKQNIEQIQKNLDLNGIEKNRYQIFQSDVFENVPEEILWTTLS